MSDSTSLSFHTLQTRLTIAALVAVAVIAWAFLHASETAMTSMRAGSGPLVELMWAMMTPQAQGAYLAAAALMWVVMMAAMMIPAVLPMALVFRGIHRGTNPGLDTLSFAAGYLAGWALFSIAAAGVQWWLHARGYLHGHLLDAGPAMAATLLVVAGGYQLTPLKEACLSRCRSPVGFFMAHWLDGTAGAAKMGLRHGLYCIGCCWMLMALMFVGGVMSVATMAALCVFILAERLLPAGPWVSRIPGVVMIAAGATLALAN